MKSVQTPRKDTQSQAPTIVEELRDVHQRRIVRLPIPEKMSIHKNPYDDDADNKCRAISSNCKNPQSPSAIRTAPNAKSTNILDLPDEILQKIALFQDLKGFSNLADSCSTLNKALYPKENKLYVLMKHAEEDLEARWNKLELEYKKKMDDLEKQKENYGTRERLDAIERRVDQSNADLAELLNTQKLSGWCVIGEILVEISILDY